MTLYEAIGREGMMEVRGFIAPGLGWMKLMSFSLWRLMMSARFLVSVVVLRRVLRVRAWVLVFALMLVLARPVRSVVSSFSLSSSLEMWMRRRRRLCGRGHARA